MTTEELSNGFDLLVSSYRRIKKFDDKENLDSVEFDEYEKSFFLTKAQEEVVIGLYSGKTATGESFENTEELRRYLEPLVYTQELQSTTVIGQPVITNDKSTFYSLPDNIAFITMESVRLKDTSLGCYNSSDGTIADVYPCTQDEYSKIKNNPFRGPTKYRVLRLDIGNNKVQLISKYTVYKYIIRYMKKVSPIILEDLPNDITIDGLSTKTEELEISTMLHQTILERAVSLALQSKITKSN